MRTRLAGVAAAVIVGQVAAGGVSVALTAPATASSAALASPQQEARARALFREIRCVVCQNESIDASQADMAGDLRVIVREQVASGRSDEEIRRFLVERYGEFVLFRPAFSLQNALLWAVPFGVVLIGGAVVFARSRARPPAAPLADEEERAVRALEAEPMTET
jgi:cytochrome c-type biogenesis protein CcmH